MIRPLPDSPSASASALAEALADDPFYIAITQAAQSPADRHQRLARYFDAAIVQARAVGQVQSAGADGAALWLMPADPVTDAAETARRETALHQIIGPAGLALYCAISDSMAARVPPAVQDGWYLSILGIRPAARGKGRAQSLLAPTLAAADQAGRVAWLETFNPQSLPFYQRLGFTTVCPLHDSVLQRDYWLMVRPARPRAF